ncbi:MAG TPA: hypothetical protein VFX98_03235, partial [Longimicrobiaceae bacterium]|nr:hypothetical protein [Longimicrobiaceae bacterium]
MNPPITSSEDSFRFVSLRAPARPRRAIVVPLFLRYGDMVPASPATDRVTLYARLGALRATPAARSRQPFAETVEAFRREVPGHLFETEA